MDTCMFNADRKVVSIHYDSIMDYMEDTAPDVNLSVWKYHAHGKEGRYWYGTSSTAQGVLKKGLLGDEQLYKSLQDKISKLRNALGQNSKDYVAEIKETRRRRTRGYQGDEVDIHAIYQGQLDRAWSRTVREDFDHQTKLVTVLIDNEDNAGTDAESSLWRAAATVLLMDELYAAGKQVRIMTYGASRSALTEYRDFTQTVTMVIKDYNSELSNARLAAMSHVGFARSCGFAAQAMMPYKLNSGLGRSVPYTEALVPLQFLSDIEAGHTKVVYMGKSNSLEKAIEKLQDATNSLKAGAS